jgi:nudix-type nucleoside diphosphatase (YffH/AdpP family)
MRETRIDDVRRVFDGHFKVDEATVAYEKADGGWSEPARRLSVERGDAAAVLVHDPARDVLVFVRQFRYPTRRHGEPWLLEIVAGGIDAGEDAETAARREAEEEIGVRLERLEKVAEMYGSPGGMSERVSIFFAEGTYAGGGGGLEGEDVEAVELPAAEAVAALDRGEIHDAKTQIALHWFARRPSRG